MDQSKTECDTQHTVIPAEIQPNRLQFWRPPPPPGVSGKYRQNFEQKTFEKKSPITLYVWIVTSRILLLCVYMPHQTSLMEQNQWVVLASSASLYSSQQISKILYLWVYTVNHLLPSSCCAAVWQYKTKIYKLYTLTLYNLHACCMQVDLHVLQKKSMQCTMSATYVHVQSWSFQ